MMDQDRFDQEEELDPRLRQAAEAYHRPPAVPREEMWAAIEAERRARRRRRAAIRTLIPWGVGVAAVLAVGVAIGRWSALRPRGSDPTVTAAATSDPQLAYRVAATQYLSRTEALLTGFRSGRVDPQFARSARDLLSMTRLMLDSPAANDPRLRSLLQDLELVLAQIAQLETGSSREEVQLINQGLKQTDVLTRVRTAIPAGPVAMTQGAL